jgi:general secretion pathway protein G
MARKHRRGFTLIELMVVIVILGIIAGIAWRVTVSNVPLSKWEAARTEMAEITKSLNEWSINHSGEFPDGLDEVADQFAGGRVPVDPFKEPYQYERTEKGFMLTCLGADGAAGGTEKADLDIVFDERGQAQPEE